MSNDKSFTTTYLLKALGLKFNSYLTTQMDEDHCSLFLDHIGIFCDWDKEKTNRKVICFYACKKETAPNLKMKQTSGIMKEMVVIYWKLSLNL